MQITVTHRLFKETTLTIEKGAVIGIVGRNGCGKTALLHQLHEQIRSSVLVKQETPYEKLNHTAD